MARKNAYLTKLQMQKQVEHDLRLQAELAIHCQLAADAAAIAANEVLKMGAGRVVAFHRAFVANYNEMINAIHDDPEHAYALIDRRIKPIYGENFVPYKERYTNANVF